MKYILIFVTIVVISLPFFLSMRRTRSNRFHTQQKKEGKPCITFQQFLDWYNVNPDPWSWKDSEYPLSFGECVVYTQGELHRKYPSVYGKSLYWETYGDKYKFMQWALEQEKQKITNNSNEILFSVMESVQKDIQKRMAEINKQTEQKLIEAQVEKLSNELRYAALMSSIPYPPTTGSNIQKGVFK